MRHSVLSMVFLTAVLVTLAWAVFAQDDAAQKPQPQMYFTYGKLRGVSNDEVMRGSSAATTIPMFSYTVTSSRDGNTYSGVMVGRSPFFHGARTTDIPAVIIPVKFTMTDVSAGAASVFDPTAADPTCSPNGSAVTLLQNSPLLNPVDFTMPFTGGVNVGSGEYVDDFQRANFWTDVQVTGNRFHTALSPISTLALQSVTVPTGFGKSYLSPGGCGSFGAITFGWWDSGSSSEAQTLIANLTTAGEIGPTVLPIFLFYNVVLDSSGESPCSSGCAGGYHNAKGPPVQTYVVADWDSTGIFKGVANSSDLSHEIAEWMDDPLGTNPAPSWGHIGQVTGCQANLEVGDPLSGTLVPVVPLNGMNYDLQELAFFSWFYGNTSLGVDGDFSDNDTFTSDAGPICE